MYSGPIDNRKKIFEGSVLRDYTSYFSGHMTYGPQDLSKSLLKYLIATYSKIDDQMIRDYKRYYNNGEDIIENDLLKLAENPEFGDCFDYESRDSYSDNGHRLKNLLQEDQESFELRMELIKLIKTYHLDLESVSRWLKRQRNVEKNDILFFTSNRTL